MADAGHFNENCRRKGIADKKSGEHRFRVHRQHRRGDESDGEEPKINAQITDHDWAFALFIVSPRILGSQNGISSSRSREKFPPALEELLDDALERPKSEP
jgi:hypothetical protein